MSAIATRVMNDTPAADIMFANELMIVAMSLAGLVLCLTLIVLMCLPSKPRNSADDVLPLNIRTRLERQFSINTNRSHLSSE